MDWFGLFEKEAPEEKTMTQSEVAKAELSGLVLKQVLDVHNAWNTRLKKVIDKTSDEVFDVEIVSQDTHCFLGRWIYGEGKRLCGHLPEYEMVRKTHAEFHECAAEVLSEHQKGNDIIAEVLLKNDFRSASNKIRLELVHLFSVAKA
jgi:Chemoreceptor zinc-binding domain